jgi:hypothetical protein
MGVQIMMRGPISVAEYMRHVSFEGLLSTPPLRRARWRAADQAAINRAHPFHVGIPD